MIESQIILQSFKCFTYLKDNSLHKILRKGNQQLLKEISHRPVQHNNIWERYFHPIRLTLKVLLNVNGEDLVFFVSYTKKNSNE